MVQATTPTFILTLPSDIDLGEAQNVYFTLRQGPTFVNKKVTTISGNTAYVSLTQAETVALMQGTASVQLNWTYSGGLRAASKIVNINIDGNLLTGVIE